MAETTNPAPGRWPFGLSDEEEARAESLHRESIVVVPTIGDAATFSVTLGGERASRLSVPIVSLQLASTAHVVEDAFDPPEERFAFRRPRDAPLRTR